MIVDFHTHNVKGRGMTELLRTAACCGIDYCVLLGDVLRYGYYPDMAQVREINDDTLRDIASATGKCCGFCFLNPCLPADFLCHEIDRCFSSGRILGVKLECACNCRRPELRPIMERLEYYHRPLLHHCWFQSGKKSIPEESDPSDIAYLARCYPNVLIIMAHLIGCGIRGIEMVADLPNVMIDTSGGQPEAGLIECAVRRIGPERLIFGSDWPYRDFTVQKAKLDEADISSADRVRIQSGNAERILKNVF